MKKNQNETVVTATKIICTEARRETDTFTAILGNGKEVFHAEVQMHYGTGGGWCVYRPVRWNGCGDLSLAVILPTRAEAHQYVQQMSTYLY